MHRVGLEPTTSKRREFKSRALTISLYMLHLLVPFLYKYGKFIILIAVWNYFSFSIPYYILDLSLNCFFT